MKYTKKILLDRMRTENTAFSNAVWFRQEVLKMSESERSALVELIRSISLQDIDRRSAIKQIEKDFGESIPARKVGEFIRSYSRQFDYYDKTQPWFWCRTFQGRALASMYKTLSRSA